MAILRILLAIVPFTAEAALKELRALRQAALEEPAKEPPAGHWREEKLTHKIFDFEDEEATTTLPETKRTGKDRYFPTMFVAISTKRESMARRNQIREMWRQADFGMKKFAVKFVICSPEGDRDGLEPQLGQEMDHFGDLLFQLGVCREEGSASPWQGSSASLNITLAAMKEYHKNFGTYELFMRTDDDTFVAWTKLYVLLADLYKKNSAHFFVSNMTESETPDRDPMSANYEPLSLYKNKSYPASPAGGVGFILGGELVHLLVNTSIADHNMLYNSEKAVGVWVDMLVQRGHLVTFVSVPGQTGYARSEKEWEEQVRQHHRGTWGSYPLMMHHRLSADAMMCLFRLERSKTSKEASIDSCFTDTDNTFISSEFRREAEQYGVEPWLTLWGTKRETVA